MTDVRELWRKVVECEPELRAYLQKRTAQSHDAADLLQATYLRFGQFIRENAGKVRSVEKLLFTIANRLGLDMHRRESTLQFETNADPLLMERFDESENPEAILAAQQQQDLLNQHLAVLPHRVQKVFQLRRVEGLSNKEVGRRLGIAESTVEGDMTIASAECKRVIFGDDSPDSRRSSPCNRRGGNKP